MWMCLLYMDLLDHTSLLDCYMLTIRITLGQTVPPYHGNLSSLRDRLSEFQTEDNMLSQWLQYHCS